MARVDGSTKHNLAVAVIPLLYETGREHDFDVVVTTACSADEQLRRVMARDGLNEFQAKQRITAQLSTEEKVRRADYTIWTDGTIRRDEATARRNARAAGAEIGESYSPTLSCAARRVFIISIVMVNGPTPPGTGVRAPATSATSGCTSPTSTDPFA